MALKYKIFLKPSCDRPDFRLVATWLWSEFHNYDSDGNSYNPASREWTCLRLCNRVISGEEVEIYPICEDPLILLIKASTSEMKARVALFLAKETKGELYEDEKLIEKLSLDLMKLEVGDFNIRKAEKRTKVSIWRKSSLEIPYPNLLE